MMALLAILVVLINFLVYYVLVPFLVTVVAGYFGYDISFMVAVISMFLIYLVTGLFRR